MVSVRQIKAARALLAWSQDALAKKSGVSYPTLARLESANGALGGRSNTAAKIVEALEAAGVIFVDENGEGPGVKLRKGAKSKDGFHLEQSLVPLSILNSSLLSVTLLTSNADGPIVVDIERGAINNRLKLSRSTPKTRRQIVQRNLDAITAVVQTRVQRKMWTEPSGSGGRRRHIILRLQDLENADIEPIQ